METEQKHQKQQTHTPVPWTARTDGDGFWWIDKDTEEGGESLADMTCMRSVAGANAEFIVRAVNCHEELVKALEGRVCGCCDGSGITYTCLDETEIGQAPGSSGIPCPECSESRAAIAKARGK